MAQYEELVQALTWLVTNRIQQKIEYTHGLLGDGNGRVRVSATAGSPEVDYVYVRPDRFTDRVFKVFNKRVQGQDGDPVIIGELPWEPDLIQVVDLDWATYSDVGWGDDVTTTNRHGTSHQWRDGAPGIDTFNVYRRQFGDLKTYPLESGTMSIGVSPYSLDLFGTQYQWPGTQSFSLLGAVPSTTGTARMALVYWSPASGTSGYLGVASGTLGSAAETTILNRPVTPQGAIPSAFVRLAGGQQSITEFNIWDAREPFRPGLSFNTGSYGLSADQIPIADDSGLYTGSTVEAALDQIGFNGARVSQVYRSDFSDIAIDVNSGGDVLIGATGTATGLLSVYSMSGTDKAFTINGDATTQVMDIDITVSPAGSAQTLRFVPTFNPQVSPVPNLFGINVNPTVGGATSNNISSYNAISLGGSFGDAYGGTMNTIRKLRIVDWSDSSSDSPAVTNQYGIFMNELTFGGANWAIYTRDATRSYLGATTNNATAGAKLHIRQGESAEAIPVTLLEQLDVDEPFTKYIGTAAAATLTRSIVDEGDVTTATRIGWIKIEIQDDGNQVTDGDYYVPFYTLA
jgi:hypothetical protein